MTKRQRLLRDYRGELTVAIKMKERGAERVSASASGEGLAKGRAFVPIDEYIQHWRTGIDELQAGADLELWEY